ncbi:PIG-L family deacetylase [Erythrobacter sp. SCSIO 43205]|uniref:PIG-L family deacetylase n=1 Tax=Erythrobacter sp. SCSIO 43205 TaxID=2779361 RepID=UPI001CA98632|nr:PIG-L family deacetylase [Erythrobacter sp. SCSIO 43205]UAB78658.1 PIG-L family deacetylase [Erythrobacter sp. SCSIO 43205]
MLRGDELRKPIKCVLACASAALVLASSSALSAQDIAKPSIIGKEETLDDGQVVTRLMPGEAPPSEAQDEQPTGQPTEQPADQSTRGQPRAGTGAPSVLAIVAHPDDELVFAPALARIAREGGEVTLVFATSGDQGPGVSGLEPGDALADLREDEARCSAFALGLEEPIYWRLGDGTLATQARNTQTAMRDMGERIAGLIALHDPSVIMTWGPDGGYGHADHRITSSAVTQIVQAMGPDRPDLLYAAFPLSEGGEDDSDAPPGFEGWARTHPSLITDRIAYEPFDLDAAMAAVNCYESQFDGAARQALAGTLHQQVWRGKVAFRLAFAKPR